MRKILNFVKGAVSTKDLIPVLTNFHFYSGRVQGGNGRVTIDAPIDLGGVDITVPAVPFLRAVDACDGEPILNITEGGRLTVKKGKFRSTIPLSPQTDFPLIKISVNDDALWKPAPGLLRVLRTIRPFIGEDASRPWACGALFKEGYVYATNNVVIVRIPWRMPESDAINVPAFAIDEILRIGEEPQAFMFDESSATLFYGERWLRTQLFTVQWPDVDKFFGDVSLNCVPTGLLEAVRKVLPFCADAKFPSITLNAEGVHTAEGTMGASVAGYELPTCRFRAEPLLLTLTHATEIDLTKYPAPVPFRGENGLQGVLVGLKA